MEWFESWFDTPFYHMLYSDRNDSEAQRFMDRLANYLEVSDNMSVLDVACGRGRHAIYLNEKGYNVTGIDLSEESISVANKSANERLRFFVRDMRNPLKYKYDLVLNLFTSFGYFETEEENKLSLLNLANALNPGGRLVIDFLNSKKAANALINQETKTVEGIDFRIHRSFENGFFLKRIEFEHEGEEHAYSEKVKALTLIDFHEGLEAAGLKILNTFGDYDLNDFDAQHSERLILIAHKVN